MRVILHPGATLATGSSFHNRKVGRTNPVGHAGSKSEPTNANNLVSVDFLLSISRPLCLQQSPIDPWCGWSAARVAKFRFSKAVAPAPTGEGRTSSFSRLRQRIGSRSPVANMFSLRCLCADWSGVPLYFDFVLPYRRHDLGPISWCGGWQRPHLSSRQPRLFGHVTKIRVT